MKYKNLTIMLLLAFCCLTVAPIIILILDAVGNGWDFSVLGRLISEIEG